ncbi:MAG: endopeptidase La [Syntrophobacteraceae bacterium]|jgi:ATP-dependent Lon protease
MMHQEIDTIQTKGNAGWIPERAPVLPLSNTVLFPDLVTPLEITLPGSRKLVDDALMHNRLVAAVAQRSKREPEPEPGDLYGVGTLASVLKLMKQTDGSYQILVHASKKVRIEDFKRLDGYWDVRIEEIPESIAEGPEIDALTLNLRSQFEKLAELAGIGKDVVNMALNVERPTQLVYVVGSNLELTMEERQFLLEIADVQTALERTTFYVTRQLERFELGRRIQDRVKAGMDKRQREFYLREQLQAIRKELGEGDDQSSDIQELRKKMVGSQMSAEAMQAAEKELERMSRMSPASADYTVARNYIDWLVEMPWSTSTTDMLNVHEAANILNEDHFDLEKVKRRILEYLAVLQLKKDLKGPILCFVGPPGVGKTSLGQSIARSLGRKFLRISLGGLRDEAEIRGHRRTYVGALPGRIIQGIKRLNCNNPVFVLDEIDKLGMDFRGDPSSALLEALDPEQNFAFTDNYLAVPFDLSKVMFIATANMLDPIPPALRDRLEIIEIPGYTAEDKLEIAKKYLVPHQKENHGIKPGQITVTDEAILEIVRSYTREAGVRGLERNIASVCRYVAKEVAEGRTEPLTIDSESLHEILGPIRFLPETATRSWGPGISTGLAWTPTGGELIFIETLRTDGSGKLILTGQLGDVMKESATAALTYIHAHAQQIGIEKDLLHKSDIHVHVPAGATPKDGPSAGVTLFVALSSLLTGREVRKDIAMTGEITLRGDILPVGGIKEKILAARRAGISEVMIPHMNAKDLEDIPDYLREGMVFHELQLNSDALKWALKGEKSA